jgi:hypothetical protein
MGVLEELVRREDQAYAELRALVSRLSTDQLMEEGFNPAWSVKDLLAHMGCWFADAANALEAMRHGTFTPRERDVDALNRRFHETWRTEPVQAVWTEFHAARARMLEELGRLPDITPDAADIFDQDGPGHYQEHLPRLREWVDRLAG